MSIAITRQNLLKTKSKSNNSSGKKNQPQIQENDEDFSAKIQDSTQSLDDESSKAKLKSSNQKQPLKTLQNEENKNVDNKSKNSENSTSQNKQNDHLLSETMIAKQVISQNSSKNELNTYKNVKDFKDDAKDENSLTKLLEKASKDKNLNLVSADVHVETEQKGSPQKATISKQQPANKDSADLLEKNKPATKDDLKNKQDAKDDLNQAKDKSLLSDADVLQKQPKIKTEKEQILNQAKKPEQDTQSTQTSKDESAVLKQEKATLGDLLKLADLPQSKDVKNQAVAKKTKKQDEKEEKQETQSQNSSKQATDSDAKIEKKVAEGQKQESGTFKPFVFDELSKKAIKQEDESGAKKEQAQTFVKTDDVQEVKYKAAQTTQTIKYFSEDLKEQIDSYRPPLMKLSLNLNPVDLGEVNITMVARGGALNVSMTSNQSALQLLMQSSGQLQQNLSALGFTNLSVNFNSSDKKSGDKKSDSNQSDNSKQNSSKQNYKEVAEASNSFIESIELKIFDKKYT